MKYTVKKSDKIWVFIFLDDSFFFLETFRIFFCIFTFLISLKYV